MHNPNEADSMVIGSQVTLPPIPHGSTNEKLIVGKLVTDLLAAGCNLSIWNGGDEPELAHSIDAAAIFAALSATDDDEIIAFKEGKRVGWVQLIWGNDCDIISNFTSTIEPLLAGANELADELLEEEGN
jgi:hypothetical protein